MFAEYEYEFGNPHSYSPNTSKPLQDMRYSRTIVPLAFRDAEGSMTTMPTCSRSSPLNVTEPSVDNAVV
jgi:hypothetical protein